MPWIAWHAPWSDRIALAALLLAGAWLLILGRRRPPHPRCRHCGYNLTGLPPDRRCPECGWLGRRAAERLRYPHRGLLTALGIVLIVTLPAYDTWRGVRRSGVEYLTFIPPAIWIWPTVVFDVQGANGWTIEFHRDRRPWIGLHYWIDSPDMDCFPDCAAWLRVRRDGAHVCWIRLHQDADRVGLPEDLPPVVDLAGTGGAYVVVEEWSGGAHCCSTYCIYELTSGAAMLRQTIDSRESAVRFEDVDVDGVLDARLFDDTFAYWRTCFACSPMPMVLLRFNGTRFVVDIERMRTAPPPDWRECAAAVRANSEIWAQWPSPTDATLWGVMLDLIYAGNAKVAFEFFDAAWPGEIAGKAQFLDDFLTELRGSPYYADILMLNGDTLPPP